MRFVVVRLWTGCSLRFVDHACRAIAVLALKGSVFGSSSSLCLLIPFSCVVSNIIALDALDDEGRLRFVQRQLIVIVRFSGIFAAQAWRFRDYLDLRFRWLLPLWVPSSCPTTSTSTQPSCTPGRVPCEPRQGERQRTASFVQFKSWAFGSAVRLVEFCWCNVFSEQYRVADIKPCMCSNDGM